MNEKTFNLTSLVLLDFVDCKTSEPDLVEFFEKHCSRLKRLEFENCWDSDWNVSGPFVKIISRKDSQKCAHYKNVSKMLKIIKSNLTNLTHLTLVDCSNFLQSIRWETLENLIHLDIYLENYDDDTGLKLSSLNKNIRYLRISGVVQMNTAGISFYGAIGFPELIILQFSGKSWDDSDLTAFRYFCKNSPKLEEIHIYGNLPSEEAYHTVYDSVAKSIGSLLNRPALRILEIDIGEYHQQPQMFEESIKNLFEYPQEKPQLEKLILLPNLPIPSIYQLVNENFNLKTLELRGRIRLESTTAIQNLMKIFKCDNGLEEIQFGLLYLYYNDEKSPWHDLAKRLTSKIHRHEFPKLIEFLESFIH